MKMPWDKIIKAPGSQTLSEKKQVLKTDAEKLSKDAAQFAGSGDRDARFIGMDAERLSLQAIKIDFIRDLGITDAQYQSNEELRRLAGLAFEKHIDTEAMKKNNRIEAVEREAFLRSYAGYLELYKTEIQKILGEFK